MPSVVTLDHIDLISMKEVNGVIRSLELRARITGLVNTTAVDVLLDAYMEAGLPVPGSPLTASVLPDPIPPGVLYQMGQLVLAGRDFKVFTDNAIDVDMHYQHIMDGDNQVLTKGGASPNGFNVPSSPVLFGKNRASVSQTKTNFYDSYLDVQAFSPTGSYLIGSVVEYKGLYWIAIIDQVFAGIPAPPLPFPPGPVGTPIGQIWGLVDEQQLLASFLLPFNPIQGVTLLPAPIRRQIVVGHQFPTDDRDNPGRVIFQTGEVTQMQPNDNFKLHGQVFIRNPRVLKTALLGAINSVPWMDGLAFEWMCTEVTWEPLYARWQWRISMEWQHNPDSWLPTAVFNDQRTGRPPANLRQGFGYRSIHKQKEIDFEVFLNATFFSSLQAGA